MFMSEDYKDHECLEPPSVDDYFGIAIYHLTQFRLTAGITAHQRERDLELLKALMEGTLRFLDDVDIDENEASLAVNGDPSSSRGRNLGIYNGAQIALVKIFRIMHKRDPLSDELLRIGKGFAYISRGIIELSENPVTHISEELVHVRQGIDLVMDLEQAQNLQQ